MIIRGYNPAVTRRQGETIIDAAEMLTCMSRSERLRLIRMIEAYNEAEKKAQFKLTSGHTTAQRAYPFRPRPWNY